MQQLIKYADKTAAKIGILFVHNIIGGKSMKSRTVSLKTLSDFNVVV